jgi:hypothetical protein
MRFEVECTAVVSQGVDKIMIHTTDELASPEEQMILNLLRERGAMEVGGNYEIIVNKLEHHGDSAESITEPEG